MLLIAGGVVLLLYAVRLAAVAMGWAFSPFDHLPIPQDHGWRALLLLGAAAALAALLWLVARHGRSQLWLATPQGGVAVDTSALEALAVHRAEADPEVVRAQADLRIRRGRLRADLRVYGRPFGDADTLAAGAAERVRSGLAAATGLDEIHVVVRPHILAVRRLARHLP